MRTSTFQRRRPQQCDSPAHNSSQPPQTKNNLDTKHRKHSCALHGKIIYVLIQKLMAQVWTNTGQKCMGRVHARIFSGYLAIEVSWAFAGCLDRHATTQVVLSRLGHDMAANDLCKRTQPELESQLPSSLRDVTDAASAAALLLATLGEKSSVMTVHVNSKPAFPFRKMWISAPKHSHVSMCTALKAVAHYAAQQLEQTSRD